MSSETVKVVHECQCNVCQAGSDLATMRHHRQMNLFLSRLNEPQRRWYVGLLSQKPGGPNDGQLSLITGLDEETIRCGRRELEAELSAMPDGRQRRAGGGRLAAEKKTRS